MTYFVQFTARRRDPRTGERYRWHWGPYAVLEDARDYAELARTPLLKGRVRVEVTSRGGRR